MSRGSYFVMGVSVTAHVFIICAWFLAPRGWTAIKVGSSFRTVDSLNLDFTLTVPVLSTDWSPGRPPGGCASLDSKAIK
jgi:hypothetical protein